MLSDDSTRSLTETDEAELKKLVSVLEISSGTTIIFAIAPESSPQHPVVRQLKESLATSDEKFEFNTFFYSENSFHNFLYSLDDSKQVNPETGRKLVMAFGIDQLPTPRLVKEMKQLNLGREELFGRNLVMLLWLNKVDFIDEFRQRAPDFWDWREKMVEFETGNHLIYPYLDWLIADNSYLKMSGVMQVNRQVDIFLDQIYVSLQAQWRQQVSDPNERSQHEFEVGSVRQVRGNSRLKEMGSNLDDWDEPCYYEPLPEEPISISISSTKTVTQKVDLSDAVRDNSCSVILGAPGAGKTTLLRYLALHFATAKRDNLETVIVNDDGTDNYLVGEKKQKDLGKTLLPIFFRIADYAEKLKPQPQLTLLEYLRQFYRQWEAHFQTEAEIGTEVAGLLLDAMRQGQCLMLLDGLDEVFDQESRKLIVERINQFVDEFPRNKFVITSRIAGYRDVQLSSRFAEFTVEDMDTEQVERFLYRWCRTVEKAQQPDASEEQWLKRGTEQAQDILLAVKDNSGVQRLTANPLLLTILALIHRNGDRLPNRRVKLYELAVQTLTEDWQLSKKLPDAPRVVLKETEVVELLAPLAYWMHEEKPSGLVTQREVEEKLAEKLAELNDTEPESDTVRQAVGDFLRKVRETTGLFVERMPGFYGFMHLTFEEYFAARYIADNDQSEILELIQKHLYEPRWNEPLLLALGYYGSHFSAQFKKLAEKLFVNLEDYQPVLQHGEIKIKSPASDDAILIYLKQDESASDLKEVEFKLRDLLFAGQVIAEIEINSIVIRKKPIQKLVITYLGIDTDFGDNTTKQLLRLLRKIEQFYQKSEVIDLLKQAVNDSTLSEVIRVKAKTAILYVACGESARLVDCVTEIVNELEPLLFICIIALVEYFGQEMTPILEACRQSNRNKEEFEIAINFITGISYIRKDEYEKAISLLEDVKQKSNTRLKSFIDLGLAFCYQINQEYEKANNYYDNVKISEDLSNSAFFWLFWAYCHSKYEKYENSLECCQKALLIIRTLDNVEYEAGILKDIGSVYQDWNKYEQAINYYQQSRELYQQLGKDKDVANQSYYLAICYREWGKYEQAVECENQDLAIRQQLDDQGNIALAYFQLGRIYQNWGKYEQAINYYQQSRELYQRLGRDKNVADQWYRLGDCYQEWGKYEQAVECENQDLAIRQQLDDQVNIADAYFQLGWIYQNWGKYEQAVNYHEQSRELYQKLGKDNIVASQWYNLANCYREWGKYEQAIECVNQDLTIRQQLDDQVNIARAHFQLGWIYQGWGKYEEAVNYYQQSRELNQQLGKDKNVANQWYHLANCYRDLKDYTKAIEYYQQSLNLHQQLGQDESIAKRYRQLASCQCLLAKNTPNSTEILDLLAQAEENIRQAIEINTRAEYKENLAYDYTTLALLYSENVRLLPSEDTSIKEKITLFEEYYHKGLTYFDELGQTVNKADEALDIACAYLEIEPLQNLNRSEEIAQECLQVFQEYNRRKLKASACKLLGEIYLKRTQQNQPGAETIATQFLADSLQIYRDLDLQEKAVEVEQLINILS